METSNFVHGSAMRSLSLVMSECFQSGRGQGHVSNFYIVDLEYFTTASRRYTGDITTTRPSSVCLWHLQDNESDSIASWLSAHCLTVTLLVHDFDLFRTCRTSSFCTVAW